MMFMMMVKINKMIRFVSEKEVDLASPKSHRKSHSLERPVETRYPAVEAPEDYQPSTEALKMLKKHNDESTLLKGRLSVLQIHEERNDFRAFVNEHRYQFHQHMREEMEKQKQGKQRHIQKVLRQINQSHEQAKQDRLYHNYNMKRAQAQVQTSRQLDYSTTKQAEKEGQTDRHQARVQEGERKKVRNYEIREYERVQKVNVKEKLDNKKREFQKQDSEVSVNFSRLKEQRKRQIQQMSKLEAVMLDRQARSKMGSQQSEIKLKKLLANRQPVSSTSHTTKLPDISSDKRTSQADLFLL